MVQLIITRFVTFPTLAGGGWRVEAEVKVGLAAKLLREVRLAVNCGI